MKKFKSLLALALAFIMVIALVACGESDDPAKTGKTPEEVVAGFSKTIDTTVKLTYVADYDVDVDANGGPANMDSFKHTIKATTVVEMDLDASNLYIHTTKTKQDLRVSDEKTVTEELLYKAEDGKYYYMTTSKAPVEVDAALAMVESILSSVTEEQTGLVSFNTLCVSDLSGDYLFKNFTLTDTWVLDDIVEPTYSVNDAEGLEIEWKPDYVGYHTDGGWSDFSNSKDGYAATVKVSTNKEGFVTSMEEVYNRASLDFAIMSIPPTVTITGSRKLTAEYGVELSKVSSVAMDVPTLSVATAENGTVEVKTCAMGDFGNMVTVANGGALELGKIVCVKGAAVDGYEIDTVTLNGSAEVLVNPVQAGGWYCFNVATGVNEVKVTFKKAAAVETTVGTLVIDATSKATVTVMTCPPGGFQAMAPVANGGEVPVGNWICVKVAPAGSNTVDSVALNGNTTPLADPAMAGGFYCYTAVAGENKVTVNVSGDDVVKATINVTNDDNVTYTLVSFPYTQPLVYTPVEDGKIAPSANMFGAIFVPTATAPTGTVTVTVDGVATSINIPSATGDYVGTFYCFSVKSATTYNVVVTVA